MKDVCRDEIQKINYICKNSNYELSYKFQFFESLYLQTGML